MKRGLFMLCLLSCVIFGVFAMPASAESAATRVDYYATVNTDGDCLVTVSVSLHLEGDEQNLTFPLPLNAEDIKLNGANVSASKVGSTMAVSLLRATGGLKGDFNLQFAYSLPDIVKVTLSDTRKPQLDLELPILAGFSYPVNSLSYTITLPGSEITSTPYFYSTYRQNGVASDLNILVDKAMITGSSKTAFNDHEALWMDLSVTEEMFPGVSTYQRTGNPELIPMGIFLGIALVYWLIFLRNLPPKKEHTTVPPAGVSAGELGCRLTLAGGDLTCMVFNWAQLGYLIIHPDNTGRVLLHKRMDMGNERSLFEVRIFNTLFGKRRVIDSAGVFYARLARKVLTMTPGERSQFHSASGNMKVFRWVCCVSHLFCGICVGMNMTNIRVLQILLAVVLAPLGAFTAWHIQEIAYRTHLRGKTRVYVGFVCILLWIILGIISHQVWIPLGSALVQFVMGYFAAYGGRRSDLNRLEMGQILGLRRYLKSIPKEDVPRLLKADPDYFVRMAPFAMALGVLKPFAAAFGKKKMECPYLITSVHGRRTAAEWAEIMVGNADRMDSRSRRMELEKWLAVQVRR